MNKIIKRTLLSTNIAILATLVSITTFADQPQQNQGAENRQAVKESRYSEPKMKDAWLQGKLEAALLLNRHLNNFTIDSEINSGKAVLSGTVESKIDSELAEQVALSINGIVSVENDLTVVPKKSDENRQIANNPEKSFSQKVEDMTTTALVKTKLLANGSTHGLAINVDTSYGVVSLNGNVKSSEEKQLAEKLAGNTDGVVKVTNLIKVSS